PLSVALSARSLHPLEAARAPFIALLRLPLGHTGRFDGGAGPACVDPVPPLLQGAPPGTILEPFPPLVGGENSAGGSSVDMFLPGAASSGGGGPPRRPGGNGEDDQGHIHCKSDVWEVWNIATCHAKLGSYR
ncbi:unnamed protein product, partial [Amoebophrya sp. A120]